MASPHYVSRLPKAELHLHLEGSATGVALQALSRKYQTEYQDLEPAEITERLFKFDDFTGFLNAYRVVCSLLREPSDYVLLLDDLADALRKQNVRYAEVIVSPAIPWHFGFDGEAVLAALLERAAEIESRDHLAIRWILDCVRQFGEEPARRTAELGVRYRDRGVAAIGLGGDENSLPIREFERPFRWAQANGLYIHVHAGEVGGVEQVWDAVRVLGANRIGHGIQAARDPRLMEYLREHAIALDICLTSNVRTRAWAPLSNHPFGLLFKRGVPVTLNTDDPGLFHTTLNEEYSKAVKYFSLEREDLHRIALQGIRSAFLPSARKDILMQEFQDEIYRVG